MAYLKTIADLRTDCRDRGDIQGNATGGFVPDAMLDRWINLALAELYDLIIHQEKDRFIATHTFNIVAGTGEYAVPANFYRLRFVKMLDSSGLWRKVPQFLIDEEIQDQLSPGREATRYRYVGGQIWLRPVPDWSETNAVRLFYNPTAPVLSGATQFDFINAWHEWLINRVCIMHAAKEESDPAVFAAELANAVQRIQAMAESLDDNEPPRIRDVYVEDLNLAGTDYWNP